MDVCLGCGEVKNRRRLHLTDAGRKVKDLLEGFIDVYPSDFAISNKNSIFVT